MALFGVRASDGARYAPPAMFRAFPLKPRAWVALGVVAGCLAAAAASFGPLVRVEVATQAARRHLVVRVGHVRPGWFAVRLRDVTVQPVGMRTTRVQLDEVRIGLTIGLGVRRVDSHGGHTELVGSAGRIQEEWARWRAGRGKHEGGRIVPMDVEGMAVAWRDAPEEPPRATIEGLSLARDVGPVRLKAGLASLRGDRVAASLGDVSVDFEKGAVERAHAGLLMLEWTPPADAPVSAPPPQAAAIGASSPVPLSRAGHSRRRRKVAVPPEDSGRPLVGLPDVRALRVRASAIAGVLARGLSQGARLSVDNLTWKVAGGAERVALTVGPGPLSVDRTGSGFDLRYSTDVRPSSTSLSVRATLPADSSDVTVALEGGPVSLSQVGIREGAAGLVDVDHAMLTGRARVVLAGDGSALTFDADGGTTRLAIHQPKLAPEVVRGLDLGLRARGALSADGEVRLDDFAASFGAFRLSGSGVFDQQPDHVSGAFRFDLPSTDCQSLLDSIPAALIPTLQGTRFAGKFGVRGRLAFDTRELDDMQLAYDMRDQCRVVEVPALLARERFDDTFEYKIYLPDGTTADQTSGPGSDNWTALEDISPYMQVAVMTTEDGAFLKHHGFNRAAIRASIIANLKARRFVRGASTITMQLAKNLFLSRDKTLARKLQEVMLTDYLEQVFSKDDLMELYLNVIEFGPSVYGITAAAQYYFGRTPAELDLAECLFLSSLLPSPLRYGAMREHDEAPETWMHLLRALMEIAHKRGLITDSELEEGLSERVVFWHGGERPPPRPAVVVRRSIGGSEDDLPAFDGPPGDSP